MIEFLGIKFTHQPVDYPGAEFVLGQTVMVLRTNGFWASALIAEVHPIGYREFLYTVKVGENSEGKPRIKQYMCSKDIR